MGRKTSGFFLAILCVFAPLSGCFGEEDQIKIDVSEVLSFDFDSPQNAELLAGEWTPFSLTGDGFRLESSPDVFMFVEDTYVIEHVISGSSEVVKGKILVTPYAQTAGLILHHPDGQKDELNIPVVNGTPIVSGEEWFDRMELILSVCSDSSQCGGYINRWMGAGNPAFERAASYFQGQFAGLGYETHMLRVTDHLNPTQPESLNVVAWKRGKNDTCVQGMGAHMDIAPPAGPPGGGTYEGAYDNTAGSVAIMLYAKALLEIEVECDTFLALWSSEEEGLRGSNAFANNGCELCLPQDKELRFYINMDMMGISWPAKKSSGDPFPYHAWSGPDFDPDVQDVHITSILEHVHFDILKAPKNLTIDGTYGAGCDQHWDEHYNLVMDVHEDTFGRSDHVTFRDLGAQTIFHLGAYDEDYSAYHSPTDTLDNMVSEVGGQENLEESIQFVMWAAFLEFILADQDPGVRNLG